MEQKQHNCSWSGRLCIKGLFPCVAHVEIQKGVQALSNWSHCLNIRWRAKALEAKDKYLKGMAEIAAGREVCYNGWFVNYVSMKPQRCPTNFEKLRNYLQKNSYVAALKQSGEVLMITDRQTLSKMFMRSLVSPTEDQLCCILLSPASKLAQEPVCNTNFDWVHSGAAGSDSDFRTKAPLSSMLHYTSVRRAFQSQQVPASLIDASISKSSALVFSVKSVKSESSRSRFDAFIKEQLYSRGGDNGDERKQRKRLYSSSSSDSERVPFSDRLRAINMQLMGTGESGPSVESTTSDQNTKRPAQVGASLIKNDEESTNLSKSLQSASKSCKEGSTVEGHSNTENDSKASAQKTTQQQTDDHGSSLPKKMKKDIPERKEKKQDKNEKVKSKTKREEGSIQQSGKVGPSLVGSKENVPNIPSTKSCESTPTVPSSVGSVEDTPLESQDENVDSDSVRMTNIFEAFKVTPPARQKSRKTTSSTHSSKHSDKNSQSSSCHSVKMSLNAVVANTNSVQAKKHKSDERSEDKKKSRDNGSSNRADIKSPDTKKRKKHKRQHSSRDVSPSGESTNTVTDSSNVRNETKKSDEVKTISGPPEGKAAQSQHHSPRIHDVHYCGICKKRCSGLQSYKKHMIKCKLKKQTTVTEFVCELCKVPCSSAENYDEHIRGSKHQRNLRGRCELCNVRCKNEETYAQHIWSPKHQKALKQQRKSGKATSDTSSSTATVKTLVKGPLQTFVGGSQLKTMSDGNLKEVKTRVDTHSQMEKRVFSIMDMLESKHQMKQLGRIPKKKQQSITPDILPKNSSVTREIPDSTTNPDHPAKKPVIDRTSPVFATMMKDLKASDRAPKKDKKSKDSKHHKEAHKSHDKGEKEKTRRREESATRKSKKIDASLVKSANTPQSSDSTLSACSSTIDPVCSTSPSTVNSKQVETNTSISPSTQNIFKSPTNLSSSLSTLVQKVCSPVEVKLVRIDGDKNLKSKDRTARKKINISETNTNQPKNIDTKAAQKKGKVATDTQTSENPEKTGKVIVDTPADTDTDDEDITGLGPPMSERGDDLFDVINKINDSDTVQRMIASAAGDRNRSKSSKSPHNDWLSTVMSGKGKSSDIPGLGDLEDMNKQDFKTSMKQRNNRKVVKTSTGLKICATDVKVQGSKDNMLLGLDDTVKASIHSTGMYSPMSESDLQVPRVVGFVLHQRDATTDNPGRNVMPLSEWASQKYDGYLVEIFQTVSQTKQKHISAFTPQVDKVTSELLNIISTRAVHPQPSTVDIPGTSTADIPGPENKCETKEADVKIKTTKEQPDDTTCYAIVEEEDIVTKTAEVVKNEKKTSGENERTGGKEKVSSEKRRSREERDDVSTSSQQPTSSKDKKRHKSEPSRESSQPRSEELLGKLRDQRSGSSDKQKDRRSGSTDKCSRTSSPLVFSSGQFADKSAEPARSRSATPVQSESDKSVSIGKRLENLAARSVPTSESTKTEKRQARQYHPYRKEKESKSAAKDTPLWSFDVAYRDMDELLQNLTENQFLELGHKQAHVGQWRKSAGRRTNWKSARGAKGRFAGFRFTRAAIPRHLPAMHSSDEEEPEEAVNPDAIPDLEERGRRADMVEEIFMGEGSDNDEDTKNFVTETCIYNTDKGDDEPERTVTMDHSSLAKQKLSSVVVIPEGNTTATFSGAPADTTDETSSELGHDFGSRDTDCSQDIYTDDDAIPDTEKTVKTTQARSCQEEKVDKPDESVYAKIKSKPDINREVWNSFGEKDVKDKYDCKPIEESSTNEVRQAHTDKNNKSVSQSEIDQKSAVVADSKLKDSILRDSEKHKKSLLDEEKPQITKADIGRRENVYEKHIRDSSSHEEGYKISAPYEENSINDQVSDEHASMEHSDCKKGKPHTSQLELETENTSKCMKDGETKNSPKTIHVEPELQSPKGNQPRTESSYRPGGEKGENIRIFSSESDITLDWTDEETALDKDSSFSVSAKTQDAVSYMMEACGEDNFIVVDACGETDTDTSIRQSLSEEDDEDDKTISEENLLPNSSDKAIDVIGNATAGESVDGSMSEISAQANDTLVSAPTEQGTDDVFCETSESFADAVASTPAEQTTDDDASKTTEETTDSLISTPAVELNNKNTTIKAAEESSENVSSSTTLSLSDRLSDSDKVVESDKLVDNDKEDSESDMIENNEESENAKTPVDGNNNIVDDNEAVEVLAESSKTPRQQSEEEGNEDVCYVITCGLDKEDDKDGTDLPTQVTKSHTEIHASVTNRELLRGKEFCSSKKRAQLEAPVGGTYEIYCETDDEKECNDALENTEPVLIVPTETLGEIDSTRDGMHVSETQIKNEPKHTSDSEDTSSRLGGCVVAATDLTKSAQSNTEFASADTVQVGSAVSAVACTSSSDSSIPESPSKSVLEPVPIITSSESLQTCYPDSLEVSANRPSNILQLITATVSQVSQTLDSTSTSSGHQITVSVERQGRGLAGQVESTNVSDIPLPISDQPIGPSASLCCKNINVPKSEPLRDIPLPNQDPPIGPSTPPCLLFNVSGSTMLSSSVSGSSRTTIFPSTSPDIFNRASSGQGQCNRPPIVRSPYLRPVSPVMSNLVQQFVHPTASHSPNNGPMVPFVQPYPVSLTPPGVDPSHFLSQSTNQQAWQSPVSVSLFGSPAMQQSQYGVDARRFCPPRFPQLSPYQNSHMPLAWNPHRLSLSPNSLLNDRVSPYHLSQRPSFYEQGQWQRGSPRVLLPSPPRHRPFHQNSPVLNSNTLPTNNPRQSSNTVFYSSYYALLNVQNVLPVYTPDILGSSPPPRPLIDSQTNVTDLTEAAKSSSEDSPIQQDFENSSLKSSQAQTCIRASLVDRPRAIGEHSRCSISPQAVMEDNEDGKQDTQNVETARKNEISEPNSHDKSRESSKEVCDFDTDIKEKKKCTISIVEADSKSKVNDESDRTCKETSMRNMFLEEFKASATDKEIKAEEHSAMVEAVEQSSKCTVGDKNRSFTTELTEFYKALPEVEAKNETYIEEKTDEHFTSGTEPEKTLSVTSEVVKFNEETSEKEAEQKVTVSKDCGYFDSCQNHSNLETSIEKQQKVNCKTAEVENYIDSIQHQLGKDFDNCVDDHIKDKDTGLDLNSSAKDKEQKSSLALICSVYQNEDSSSCDSTAKFTQSTITSFEGVFKKELEKESASADDKLSEAGTPGVVASVESIFQNCKWSANVDASGSSRSASPAADAETVEEAVEALPEITSKDELESDNEPSLQDSASGAGSDRPLLSCFIKDSSSSVQTSRKTNKSDVTSSESEQSRSNRAISNLRSRGIVCYQTDDRHSDSSTIVDTGKKRHTSSETTRSSERSENRTHARAELFSSPTSDCRYQYTKEWLKSSADLGTSLSYRKRHQSESGIKAYTKTRSDESGSDKSRSPCPNTRRHGGYDRRNQSGSRQSNKADFCDRPSWQDRDRGRDRYGSRIDNRTYFPRTGDHYGKHGSRSVSSGSDSRFYKSGNTARYRSRSKSPESDKSSYEWTTKNAIDYYKKHYRSRSKSLESDRSDYESNRNHNNKYYPNYQGSMYKNGNRSGSNDSNARRSWSKGSPAVGSRNHHNSRHDYSGKHRPGGKFVNSTERFRSPSYDSDLGSRSSGSVSGRGMYRARHSSGSSPYSYRPDEGRRQRFASGGTSSLRNRNRLPSHDSNVLQKSSSQQSDMSNPFRRRHYSQYDDYSDKGSHSSFKGRIRKAHVARPERSRQGDLSEASSSDSEGTVVERRGRRSKSSSSSASSRRRHRSRSTDSSVNQSSHRSSSNVSKSDSDDTFESDEVDHKTSKSKLTRQKGAIFKRVSSTIQHRRYRSRREGSVGDNNISNTQTDTFHTDRSNAASGKQLSKDRETTSTHNSSFNSYESSSSINKFQTGSDADKRYVKLKSKNLPTETETKLPTKEHLSAKLCLTPTGVRHSFALSPQQVTSKMDSGEQDRRSGTSSLSEGEVISEGETGNNSELTKEELAELERDQAVKKVFLQPAVLFNITPGGLRELLDGLLSCSSACCVWKLLLASSQMSQLALMYWDPKLVILKSRDYSRVVEVADDQDFTKNEDLALHQIRCNANIRKIFMIRDEDEYDAHSTRLGLKKCTLADFTKNYLKPV